MEKVLSTAVGINQRLGTIIGDSLVMRGGEKFVYSDPPTESGTIKEVLQRQGVTLVLLDYLESHLQDLQ